MNDGQNDFTSKLLQAARSQSTQYDSQKEEVEEFIERKLASRDRWTNLFIVLLGAIAVAILIFLAGRANTLPWYPAVPALFYLVFAAMITGGVVIHAVVAIRGRYNEIERSAKADWAMWCAIVMVNTLYIWWLIHPNIPDRNYLAIGAVALLVLAIAESLRCQIRLIRLSLGEQSIKTQLHFAELTEKLNATDTSSSPPVI